MLGWWVGEKEQRGSGVSRVAGVFERVLPVWGHTPAMRSPDFFAGQTEWWCFQPLVEDLWVETLLLWECLEVACLVCLELTLECLVVPVWTLECLWVVELACLEWVVAAVATAGAATRAVARARAATIFLIDIMEEFSEFPASVESSDGRFQASNHTITGTPGIEFLRKKRI